MSTKQVRYVPPSERKHLRERIEAGDWFTVIEFAAAHKLLHDTARKQLEKGAYEKRVEGRDAFYRKAGTR